MVNIVVFDVTNQPLPTCIHLDIPTLFKYIHSHSFIYMYGSMNIKFKNRYKITLLFYKDFDFWSE